MVIAEEALRFPRDLLRRAGATVRNQNPLTSKIEAQSRLDRYGRAVGGSAEAGQSHRCPCARGDCRFLFVGSGPAARSLSRRASAQPRSSSPVLEPEAIAYPLAAGLRNQADAVRRCEDRAPVRSFCSKPRYCHPQTSVGAHCKGSERQEDQIRAASNTRAYWSCGASQVRYKPLASR
jgi:hypothetical protein